MGQTNLISVTETNVGAEVIDLTYVKLYCSISTSTHDTLLTSLIKSARTEIEKLAKISIVTRTLTAIWSEAYTYVDLPRPQINGITSVSTGDNIYTVDNGYTIVESNPSRIYGDYPNGLKVVYTAGYGTDTPEDLKLAMAKKVLEDFEQRTGIKIQSNNNSVLLPNNWRPVVLNYRPGWMMF